MRYCFGLMALLVVAACANPNAGQEAADRCAAVGISTRDADFGACTKAYTLESEQNALKAVYDRTIPSGIRPRRATHCTDTGAC